MRRRTRAATRPAVVVNVGLGSLIRQRSLDCHSSGGIEAELHLKQVPEAAQQKGRLRSSRRDDAGHQSPGMAQARAPPGTVGAPTLLPKRRRQIKAGGEPRGSKPEDGSRSDRDGSGDTNTPQPTEMSLRRGRLSGTNCNRNFRAQKRTTNPLMPPSTKSNKLSVRS